MPRQAIQNAAVAAVFAAYPPKARRKLLQLRAMIFRTAAATPGVGQLEETLKWGEPAYLTTASGSGTTLRLGWKGSDPDHICVYVNCQTSLLRQFRSLFPASDVRFDGNRAIVLDVDKPLPADVLGRCIAMAQTYHHSPRPPKPGPAAGDFLGRR